MPVGDAVALTDDLDVFGTDVAELGPGGVRVSASRREQRCEGAPVAGKFRVWDVRKAHALSEWTRLVPVVEQVLGNGVATPRDYPGNAGPRDHPGNAGVPGAPAARSKNEEEAEGRCEKDLVCQHGVFPDGLRGPCPRRRCGRATRRPGGGRE